MWDNFIYLARLDKAYRYLTYVSELVSRNAQKIGKHLQIRIIKITTRTQKKSDKMKRPHLVCFVHLKNLKAVIVFVFVEGWFEQILVSRCLERVSHWKGFIDGIGIKKAID